MLWSTLRQDHAVWTDGQNVEHANMCRHNKNINDDRSSQNEIPIAIAVIERYKVHCACREARRANKRCEACISLDLMIFRLHKSYIYRMYKWNIYEAFALFDQELSLLGRWYSSSDSATNHILHACDMKSPVIVMKYTKQLATCYMLSICMLRFRLRHWRMSLIMLTRRVSDPFKVFFISSNHEYLCECR